MSASGVRTTADGIIDGVWQDAWSFYVASQYRFSDRNRLEFYALGAPQRHGQRSYRLNIATLDREFAASLSDYDPAGLARFANEAGRFWSPNVAGVDPSYNGRQFNSTGPGAGVSSRFDRNFLNERENYFHKPQVNLNWYSYLGDGLTASTVAYYSGGSGGGTGPYGSLRWDYTYNQRAPDWNATIARNRGNDDGAAYGIIRNSVNNQTTWGAIAKLQKDFDDGLVANFGVDWRTATIAHYREVRDLLGGTFYNDCFRGCSSDFWTEAEGDRGLGDKIHYHNENDVNWVGVHLQAEKSSLAGSFYGMAGVSRISYDFIDFFTRGSGGFHEVSSGGLTGYQIKGGAMRNLDAEWSVYGNVGLVSKVPIFDGVIDDGEGVLLANPQNETFTSFEAGTRFRSLNRQFSFDANVYFTQWNDRTRHTLREGLLRGERARDHPLAGNGRAPHGDRAGGRLPAERLPALRRCAVLRRLEVHRRHLGQLQGRGPPVGDAGLHLLREEPLRGRRAPVPGGVRALGVPDRRILRSAGREDLRKALRQLRSLLAHHRR